MYFFQITASFTEAKDQIKGTLLARKFKFKFIQLHIRN